MALHDKTTISQKDLTDSWNFLEVKAFVEKNIKTFLQKYSLVMVYNYGHAQSPPTLKLNVQY